MRSGCYNHINNINIFYKIDKRELFDAFDTDRDGREHSLLFFIENKKQQKYSSFWSKQKLHRFMNNDHFTYFFHSFPFDIFPEQISDNALED